jgi:hypothetical protein
MHWGEAQETWLLALKAEGRSPATLDGYPGHLAHFNRFLEAEGVSDVAELTTLPPAALPGAQHNLDLALLEIACLAGEAQGLLERGLQPLVQDELGAGDLQGALGEGLLVAPIPRGTFQRRSKSARCAASSPEARSKVCDRSAVARRFGGTLGRPLSRT